VLKEEKRAILASLGRVGGVHTPVHASLGLFVGVPHHARHHQPAHVRHDGPVLHTAGLPDVHF